MQIDFVYSSNQQANKQNTEQKQQQIDMNET